jgi:hypothetical protein
MYSNLYVFGEPRLNVPSEHLSEENRAVLTASASEAD